MNHLKHLTRNGMFFGWQNVDGYQRMQNYPKILQNRTDRIKTHKSVVGSLRRMVRQANYGQKRAVAEAVRHPTSIWHPNDAD